MSLSLCRTKPGHYMEYALARLLASNVTVLFSQSQGKRWSNDKRRLSRVYCHRLGVFAIEDSAALLAKLVETEGRKGHAISLPNGLQDQAQPVRT